MDEQDGGDEIEYSVVVPVYDSVESVRELVGRLHAVFTDVLGASYEVILIDDGSDCPDTWPMLESLAETFDAVESVQLSRNFGKASAVLCGFERARGRWVITMDDDLQHLPEDLPKFVEHRDHDVVMGRYIVRRHPLVKRATSRIKGWFDRIISGKPKHLVSNPFRLYRAWVVEAMCGMKSPYPFISAMMYYTTRDIVTVDVEHAERTSGGSRFGFWRRVRSFSNLMINRSAFLMRLIAFVGLFVSGVSFAGSLTHMILAATGTVDIDWLVVLSAVVVFLLGLALFATAVIGEYLTRILVGVERRPPYIVRGEKNGDTGRS